MNLFFLFAGAAEQRLDAGQQDFHGEGFRQVVVADGKPFDDVILHVFGCDEDDGHVFVHFPNALGEREPVLDGHHHIHQTDVEILGTEHLVGLFAVVGMFHDIILGCQVRSEDLAEVDIVLCQ